VGAVATPPLPLPNCGKFIEIRLEPLRHLGHNNRPIRQQNDKTIVAVNGSGDNEVDHLIPLELEDSNSIKYF
jgi:hypothetical protein